MRHSIMRMTRLAGAAVVATLAVALAACDPADSSEAPDETAAGSSAAVEDTGDDGSGTGQTEENGTEAALQAMTLTKTGGITGENTVLEVTADGGWGLTGRSAAVDGAFDTDTVTELAALQSDPDLMVTSKDKPDHQCNDMYNYVLDIGGKQMTTDSCGQAPNQVFADLVELLSDRTGI